MKVVELTVKELDKRIEAVQQEATGVIEEINRLNQRVLILSGKQQGLMELKEEAEAAAKKKKDKKE